MDEKQIDAINLVRFKWQKEQVDRLGHTVGYGCVMQLAQECWREHAEQKGLEGSEHTTGPCATFTVPCGCDGSCDWCCGSGWVTKKVNDARADLSNLLEACKRGDVSTPEHNVLECAADILEQLEQSDLGHWEVARELRIKAEMERTAIAKVEEKDQ